MSSSERSPYANLNEQLRQLARDPIRNQDRERRLDDSTSSHEFDDEKRSGEDSDQDLPPKYEDCLKTRARSRSRERQSGYFGRHVPESANFDSSPSDYGIRYRQEAAAPRTPPENYARTPPRRHSTPQRAAYAGDESTNYIKIVSLVAILFLLVIALIFYSSRGSTNQNALRVPKKSMADVFMKDVDQLKKAFPNQRPRLWSTIRSSIRGVFDRFDATDGEIKVDKSIGERSPAVVLLVADSEDDKSRATASCLAKRLAEITSKVFAYGKKYMPGYFKMEGSDFIDQNSQSYNVKKMLETQLDGYLTNKRASPVVVLRNVHLLSSEAALILHAYCDNENAPFKEAIYLLTVDCGDDDEIGTDHVTNATEMDDGQEPRPPPIPISKTEEKDWDGVAEMCLRIRWLETGNLNVDKIAPILSRIANNVVFVYPEQTVDC